MTFCTLFLVPDLEYAAPTNQIRQNDSDDQIDPSDPMASILYDNPAFSDQQTHLMQQPQDDDQDVIPGSAIDSPAVEFDRPSARQLQPRKVGLTRIHSDTYW